MADIHIHRQHDLGLAAARDVALQWAAQAQSQFGMECSHEPGTEGELFRFSRSGVQGTLDVTGDSFEVTARLGMLVGMFKEKIEAEMVKNLDALLDRKVPAPQAAAQKPATRKKAA